MPSGEASQSRGWPHGKNVTVGVVGPHDLVERVLTLQSSTEEAFATHLVGIAYETEEEVVQRLRDCTHSVDSYVFTGPVPYDIAISNDAITAPATFISLSGAALYAALIRGTHQGAVEPESLSIDTLKTQDVTEAYDELGLSVDGVAMLPYSADQDLDDIVEFHVRAHREQGVTGALTGLRSAYHELRRLDVPALRMTPIPHSIRLALRTAALMATGARLEGAQAAVALVTAESLGMGSDGVVASASAEESRLLIQARLLRLARPVGALVFPVESGVFLVAGTLRAFESMSEGFQRCPFYDQLVEETGEEVTVGIGFADSVLQAQTTASHALQESLRTGGGHGRMIQSNGVVVVLPGRQPTEVDYTAPRLAPHHRRYVARVARALEEDHELLKGSDPTIVSAEQIAELLEVTPRTARRVLGLLSDLNLAWPLPPERERRRGRPKHRWRLLVERFPREELW